MSEIKGDPTDGELSDVDDKLMSPGWINLLDGAGLSYRERQVIGWALRMAPRMRSALYDTPARYLVNPETRHNYDLKGKR